jgi:dTDP-glucose 4,6-dehydratase/UDP-glucuronate decarboxylase
VSAQASTVIREDAEAVLDDLEPELAALRGSTLLVTGASGFLCSWFVETIAALNRREPGDPCRLIAVDNHVTGPVDRLAEIGGDWLTVVEHDVTHPLELDEPVDWIVNGASIASPPAYRRFPLETIDVNVSGTRHSLELARARGARGVLHLSSSEIYGDPDPAFVPTSEEYVGRVSCTGPRACYDESKRLSETLCMTYHRLYGLPVKVVRPFNVYGPGQRLDDGRIMPDILGSLVRREPITLFSDGYATRAFCYATDAIRAMWLVLLRGEPGGIFNVGNDEQEIPIGELARLAATVGGPPALPVVFATSDDADYVSDNPQRRCPDLTKLRTELGWTPRVPLATGIERAYRANTEAA